MSVSSGAQSNLIGTPQPMRIEAVLAAQIGGLTRVLPRFSITPREAVDPCNHAAHTSYLGLG